MDLKIDKSTINQHNFMNFLHDTIAGKINIKDSIVKIQFWDNFELNGKSKYTMIACFGNNPCENINIYQYHISQGEINGTLMDLSEIVNENFLFQIIEIGYMNSVFFLKGSIVEDNRLIGKRIIIEFVFDENNYNIEITNS